MRRKRSLYQGEQIKALLKNRTFYLFCQLPDQDIKTIDLLKAKAEKVGLGFLSIKNKVVSHSLKGSSEIEGISNLLQGPVYLVYPLEEVTEFSDSMFHFLGQISKEKTINFLGLKWDKKLYTADYFQKTFLESSSKGSLNLEKRLKLVQLIQSNYMKVPQSVTNPILLLARVLKEVPSSRHSHSLDDTKG